MSRPSNWLITGGCGFIGTSLIGHIQKTRPGDRIRVLDNLSTGGREDLSEVCGYIEMPRTTYGLAGVNPVELLAGDIRNYETCEGACKGMDMVAHLAANTGVGPSVSDPRADMESNVIGIFNMLEASRRTGVGKFIFASSCAPVGETEPPITESKPPKPVSPYGASKLAGEGYCSAYYRTYGLKTVSLRFGNVYGPRSKNKSSAVARFFKLALKGGPMEIYGDGNQTRDFIYIDDLIQAIMLSAEADLGGEVFQVATCRETTVNEIAEKIKAMVEGETGRKVEILRSGPRQGDVRRNYSDISKATNMLGYAPVFGLEDGLRETFQYFKNQKPQ